MLEHLGSAQQLDRTFRYIVSWYSDCPEISISANERPLNFTYSLDPKARGKTSEPLDKTRASDFANKVLLVIADCVACT